MDLNLNNFNCFQQVFILFYAILYGVMLGATFRFQPFPIKISDFEKTKLNQDKNKIKRACKNKLLRLILSFIILNFFPFIYFIIILLFILDNKIIQDMNSRKIFILMLASVSFGLSVFGWYRIYQSFILGKRTKNCFSNDLWQIDKNDGGLKYTLYPENGGLVYLLFSLLYFALPWIFIFVYKFKLI